MGGGADTSQPLLHGVLSSDSRGGAEAQRCVVLVLFSFSSLFYNFS